MAQVDTAAAPNTATAPRRLLIALAHPDDESFGSGALIAKLVASGIEVYYICATKGDRGTMDQAFIDTYGSVAATRDAELDCASEKLGFKAVYKFGYSDSGMMGTADNDDPACLWQADEAAVAAQIVRVMRDIRPQVVLTFDPFGAYGHPDHIYMHRATTRAFYAAGDAAQFPEAGAPFTPQKLYYSNISRTAMRMGILMQRLQFKNPRKLGKNKDIDMVEILNHIPPAHARIDVGDYFEVWDAASACHASQGGGSGLGVPKWMRRLLFRRQTLTRAFPAPRAGEPIEDDLFAGVRA